MFASRSYFYWKDTATVVHGNRHLAKDVVQGFQGGVEVLTWEYDKVAINEANRLLGKYMLVTDLSKKDYDADQLLELYKSRLRRSNELKGDKLCLN